MTRKLLTIGAATAFVVASFGAWAQNANDGPKYSNMESHKQYKDQRIEDHNNAAPRYAVTSNPNKHYTDQRIMDHNNAAPRYAVASNPNRHYTDQRIMDHNNAAPRYAVTTTGGQHQASSARQRVRAVHTIRRQAPTVHANARLVHHG